MACAVDGLAVIHIATLQDDRKLVEYLLEQGADINAWSLSTPTPLHIAALLRHSKMVKYLLGKGADVNAGVWTYPAGDRGSPGTFRDYGTSQVQRRHDASSRPTFTAQFVASYWVPLHWAVIGGDAEIVRMLLKAGASVNQPGGRVICAWTPLHLACLWRRPRVVQALLDNGGADINNISGTYNLTPLMALHAFHFILEDPHASARSKSSTTAAPSVFMPGRGSVKQDRDIGMASMMEETNLANIGVGMERFMEPGTIFRDGSMEELLSISEVLVKAGADLDLQTDEIQRSADSVPGKQSAASIIARKMPMGGDLVVAKLRRMRRAGKS